jgi:hypothetical protein
MGYQSGSSKTIGTSEYVHNARPITYHLMNFWEYENFAFFPFSIVFICFLYPSAAPLLIGISIPIIAINLFSSITMPAFTPESSNERKDPNLIKQGKETEIRKPNAITCLGMDRITKRQIWINADYDKRHHKIIATTGSGKTFGLRFNILMALVQCTGIVVIDGKGDETLPIEVWHLLRRFGRETDFLFLNFKQGSKNVYNQTYLPKSNTFNPFCKASSSGVSEMLKSLLSQDDEKSGGGDFWSQRAAVFVDEISRIVTYKRDHFGDSLRVGTLREYLELRALCKVYTDERIPNRFKSGLETYFKTLPDFEIEDVPKYANGEEFAGKILEQHGYVSMQLQPALSVLADDYGYIFDTDTPDIDMDDVAVNNRVLFGLLPALEKAPATTANTGKIILAALKSMISGQLGNGIEGNLKAKSLERACEDKAPFPVKLDESGYYAAVSGIEVLPAQGRGLGFAFSFIAQTYEDWEKAGGKTAEIIWGNTNNTTIGKTETDITFDKVNKRLGQVSVLEQATVDVKTNFLGFMDRFMPSHLTLVKKDQIEMKDLTSLREGQYKQIFDTKMIDMQIGDPIILTEAKELRLNHLCPLAPISEDIIQTLQFNNNRMLTAFKENIKNSKSIFNTPIKLRPNLDSLINAHAMRISVSQSPLNIEDWQKIFFDLAATQEESDKQEVDEIQSEFADAIASIRKTGKKTNPPKKKEVKDSNIEESEETLDWFQANKSNTLDIDIENQTSMDGIDWGNYEPKLESIEDEGLLSTPLGTEKEEDVLSYFEDNNNNEIEDDFDEEIDDALDKIGIPKQSKAVDDGDDTDRSTLQLEFPGLDDLSNKIMDDSFLPEYPPKRKVIKDGISEIVKNNVQDLEGSYLDLNL